MKYIKKNLKFIILAIISIIAILFVYNDHELYKTPILKITSIEEIREPGINNEEHITQNIIGIIKNGEYKGKTLKTINYTSTSGVYDEKLSVGNEVFVELSNDGNNIIGITNVKRDKYLVILLVLFIDAIILVAGKIGLFSLISLVVNIVLTGVAILLFQKSAQFLNILLIFSSVSILFIIISLFITNGKSKKTLAAIVSSIVSLFVSFGLCFGLVKLFGNGIPFWTLEYVEIVRDYENFFYVCVLLGGLGAIMDISITLSSSLNELIVKDPEIKLSALLKSGKEISKDIVGTMANVMLFTCYTSIIPMCILAIRNNMTLFNTISYYGEVELILVLTSCISIVLAIPISLYTSAYILTKRRGLK